jgi:hypothetical protein
MKDIQHPFLLSMNSLEVKVEQLLREYRIHQIRDPQFIILDNADFIQMFKISPKTAQTWRDEGLIQFAQVKGKIYYKLKDIQEFLNNHKGRKEI